MMNVFRVFLTCAALLLSSITLAADVKGEFGQNCTNGLSKGVFHETKCEINEVYKGKTYCFSNEGARDSFLLDQDNMIAKAEKFYAANKEVDRVKISQADALKQINSKTCDLSNKDAGYLIFNGLDLSHCNMQNVGFFGAELMGAKLVGANMKGAYLNLARIENADFTNANLTNAIIFQAIFDKAIFHGANLTNARMIGTLGNVDMANAIVKNGKFGLDIGNQPMGAMRFDAIGGRFSNTNFEGADINRSNFRFADLRGANLRNTDLFRADFSKADLTGADITGAKMGEAVLDGTIMTDVKGLEAIKGYDEAKGKCINCTIMATSPKSENAPEVKKLSSANLNKLDLMTAENPAKSFCRMGARF
jgi:uncharacterized protein YjbI with pentapeptide repeats